MAIFWGFNSFVTFLVLEVGMLFRKTVMGWMDESGDYWDNDDFADMLLELGEGTVLRVLADDEDDDDNDS